MGGREAAPSVRTQTGWHGGGSHGGGSACLGVSDQAMSGRSRGWEVRSSQDSNDLPIRESRTAIIFTGGT